MDKLFSVIIRLILICSLFSLACGSKPVHQSCINATTCDLNCTGSDLNCHQNCTRSPCQMSCNTDKTCIQTCSPGNCGKMECLGAQTCSLTCDKGHCSRMSCQASVQCFASCSTGCIVTCHGPCTVSCMQGNCTLRHQQNQVVNFMCPANNCRKEIITPRPSPSLSPSVSPSSSPSVNPSVFSSVNPTAPVNSTASSMYKWIDLRSIDTVLVSLFVMFTKLLIIYG